MNVISKVRNKIARDGVKGMMASALRHAAYRLDRNLPFNVVKKRSEYLTWVGYAVPGMLSQGNIEAMEFALVNMPPGHPILEIGSFCGLSTVVISYLLDKNSLPANVFTCDKWEFETQQLGAPLGDSPFVTHDMYQAYVKNIFMEIMKTFAGHRLPHTIENLSDEFFERWFGNEEAVDVFDRLVNLGGPIGFCYIDGNHSYDFAKRDFENADRALVSGGFILFDDSADGSGWEVNQLTREIEVEGRYELISKTPNYLFRKIA